MLFAFFAGTNNATAFLLSIRERKRSFFGFIRVRWGRKKGVWDWERKPNWLNLLTGGRRRREWNKMFAEEKCQRLWLDFGWKKKKGQKIFLAQFFSRLLCIIELDEWTVFGCVWDTVCVYCWQGSLFVGLGPRCRRHSVSQPAPVHFPEDQISINGSPNFIIRDHVAVVGCCYSGTAKNWKPGQAPGLTPHNPGINTTVQGKSLPQIWQEKERKKKKLATFGPEREREKEWDIFEYFWGIKYWFNFSNFSLLL